MASRIAESRIGEVVAADLIVPEVDIIGGVGEATVRQVLAVVRGVRVIGRAFGGIVCSVGSESVVPDDGGRSVTSSVGVVPLDHLRCEVGRGTTH